MPMDNCLVVCLCILETSEYLRMEIAKAAEKTGLAIRKGLIVTGDTFVDSAEKIAKIKKEFP